MIGEGLSFEVLNARSEGNIRAVKCVEIEGESMWSVNPGVIFAACSKCLHTAKITKPV